MSGTDQGDDKTMIMAPSAILRKPAPKARLTCVDTSVLESASGVTIDLDGGETSVGRGNENDVPLKADGISRKHARIFPADECWGIEDLGSTNGIRVNNSKVNEAFLKDGDTVAIGRVCYKFEIVPEASEVEGTGSHQLDLGEDKTMIMAPPKRPQAAAAKPASPKPAPAAATPSSIPSRPAPAAAKPAATKSGSGSSGMLLWGLVIAGVVLLGAAVFLML